MSSKARWDEDVKEFDEQHGGAVEEPRPSACQPPVYVQERWTEKSFAEAFYGVEGSEPKDEASSSDEEHEQGAWGDTPVGPAEEKIYDPKNYKITKTGYQNYCCLLISLYRMGRFEMLDRSIDKLLSKEKFRMSVLMLSSHIQKFGDTGPRRMGWDFD